MRTKVEAYENYKEYFKYNYGIELPPMEPSATNTNQIYIHLNASLMKATLENLGVTLPATTDLRACLLIATSNNWDNLKYFEMEILLDQIVDKWMETVFRSYVQFYNLVQSNTFETLLLNDQDMLVNYHMKETPFEVFQAYMNQKESIGGDDMVGILDI